MRELDKLATKMPQQENQELSIDEKKRFICAKAKSLSQQDAIDVGKVLVRNGLEDMLKFNSNDVRVNLDQIPVEKENVIDQVYNQLVHKLNKSDVA